ncbi:Aspartate aminotransferase, cytoplasmic [Umbelopsis sp. WA50703]
MSAPSSRLNQLNSHMQPTQNVSFFQEIPQAAPDAIFNLTAQYKADTDAKKINVGVGAYRDDSLKPYILPVVKKADAILFNDENLDHEYQPIAGQISYTTAAAKLILGADSPAFPENRVVAVQTISGTGANHTAAAFLKKYHKQGAICLLSKPTWANHKAIFNNVGIEVAEYPYWNPSTRGLDLEGMLGALEKAPEQSIVLLHACAHNPTGVDPTREQWQRIADVVEKKKHFPFFDCAYQGFASGSLDQDAWAVRYFVQRGFEMFICQSFAKNFGLYGERTGNLTVVTRTAQQAQHVLSQLEILQRSEISNPPAYGSRIVDLVLNDKALYTEWTENLKTMSGRIIEMRQRLFEKLQQLETPGTWNHIVDQIGMFSFTGLTAPQVKVLKEKYHIYMTENGRISMAGLSSKNVDYFAEAVNDVVRNVSA